MRSAPPRMPTSGCSGTREPLSSISVRRAGAACRPRRFLTYIVGRVTLADAVPFAPPDGMIWVADDELRAASARIVELYILAGSCDPQLGELLAARYQVPVHTL